jgi:hypothetical protein
MYLSHRFERNPLLVRDYETRGMGLAPLLVASCGANSRMKVEIASRIQKLHQSQCSFGVFAHITFY